MYGGGPPQNWQPPPQGFQPNFHQPPPHLQFQQGAPPPGFQPPPFQRPGLGAPGAAANLPPPPHLQTGSGFPGVVPSQAWNGEKFSLFVGSIAEGVVDGWLERILGTAGSVLSMRRPSPPFAFVEYGDPESVLRCLEVVNGAIITGTAGVAKAILVKADEKTRARLDEYEASRVKNEQTEEFLLRAKDDLDAIIRLMEKGDAPATSSLAPEERAKGGPPDRSTSHLQDLAPEDLPPEQRVVITSEIASFRERAAKKAAEKKEYEMMMERRRFENNNNNNNMNNRRGGPQQQQGNNGWGPRGGQQQQHQQQSPTNDPQSYNKPVGFVAAGAKPAEEGGREESTGPNMDDFLREKDRLEHLRRESEALFRDRERRFEGWERARINNVEREKQKERGIAQQEDHDRVALREKLALWDDVKEMERGRELFYSDRTRWRAQRRPFRAREMEADKRDRQLEADQLAALQLASENFLNSQADMFAKLSEGAMRTSGEEGVKLSFGASAKPVAKPVVGPRPSGVLGAADDEEDGKKKRELIPLDYEDEEEEKPRRVYRMTEREKERARVEVLAKVPKTKQDIWTHHLPWSYLSEALITEKIVPFTNKSVVESLGAEEEELVSAVVEHIKAHKNAAGLVEEIEPVLDEEATEFVMKIWKELITELELAKAGV